MSPTHFCRVTPKMGVVGFREEFSNRAITVDHGDGRKAFNRLVLRLATALPSNVGPKHVVYRNEFVFIGNTLRCRLKAIHVPRQTFPPHRVGVVRDLGMRLFAGRIRTGAQDDPPKRPLSGYQGAWPS